MRFRGRTALLLIAPAGIIYLALVLYPMLRGVQLSLTDAKGISGGHFIGLTNFRRAWDDSSARSALLNTLKYTVVVVILQNALALLVAYGLFQIPRLRNFIRGGLLIPAMMAMVAVAYIWSFIYAPDGGPLNNLLKSFGLTSWQQSWLGDPHIALWAIMTIYIWMYTGYAATIFLSNYLAIPAELFEVAALDGASRWQRFKWVDWRLLAPSLTVNITLSTIGSLRVFDLPFILTHGGPVDSTQTLSLQVYQQSFGFFDFGYGTALAVILLIITVVVGVVQASVLGRREVQF